MEGLPLDVVVLVAVAVVGVVSLVAYTWRKLCSNQVCTSIDTYTCTSSLSYIPALRVAELRADERATGIS